MKFDHVLTELKNDVHEGKVNSDRIIQIYIYFSKKIS